KCPGRVFTRASASALGRRHSRKATMEYSTDSVLSTPPLPCHRCGIIDTPTLRPGSGPHFAAARCQHCGSFIKWISRHQPVERDTRRERARLKARAQKPPSPLQLAYLRSLGHTGPEPATMTEASRKIDVLLHEGNRV